MNIIFSVEDIASIATALGVAVAAWQIWESRSLAQTTFEDSLEQQYRNLAMQIPVDVLLGKTIAEEKKSEIREIIYNYLDLCNEQIYLRVKKRVRKNRWKDWQDGIKQHLKNPSFIEVWEEIKKESPLSFTFLTKLEECDFNCDPAKNNKFKA
jgi:hypothetical protein